jgi:glycosyltransferase involved in cell wall biosynthesis
VSIPTTSFIVTCHNLGAYLDEALDSLYAQTVQDFEVVVVNDGSTDGATCRLLADLNRPRTRVVHSERRGLPGARNFGARHAGGRYLCMVDADDLLEPTYLERSLAAIESRPDVAFASHWLRAFGDEAWDWTPADCGFPALLHANTVNGAALLRREVFDRVNGFDESMLDGCEDWEFWIRVVDAGYAGVIIPEFLFRYRRRADSMSRAMHAVPGMPALYRQLVERHPDVFARHLVELLERRDSEIASLSTSLWRLEQAWTADLEGRQQWWIDNEVGQSRAQAERDLQDRAQQLEPTQAEVRALHAAFNRERELQKALRASWSWRVTVPLRALLGWVRR